MTIRKFVIDLASVFVAVATLAAHILAALFDA